MLSLTSEDYFLEEVDSHIQANLEDAVVQEALKSGVDLREYSAEVEEELKKAENSCIGDFIRESQNIASLHHQIVECDQILERMEDMLKSFQTDLGSISNEILTLQQVRTERSKTTYPNSQDRDQGMGFFSWVLDITNANFLQKIPWDTSCGVFQLL